MNINHRPILDVKYCEEFYTKKDGVPIKYVCTTALNDGAHAGDVFYRDTPHPQFGNKYFQLISRHDALFICGADVIETLTFDMLYADYNWHYSQHRHDFVSVEDWAIDGGRAYTKVLGRLPIVETLRVKNGEFEFCEST